MVYDENPYDEPIVITYDRAQGTITFKSKTFEYYQTDLPKDVHFSVYTWLGYSKMEADVEILEIDWT